MEEDISGGGWSWGVTGAARAVEGESRHIQQMYGSDGKATLATAAELGSVVVPGGRNAKVFLRIFVILSHTHYK